MSAKSNASLEAVVDAIYRPMRYSSSLNGGCSCRARSYVYIAVLLSTPDDERRGPRDAAGPQPRASRCRAHAGASRLILATGFGRQIVRRRTSASLNSVSSLELLSSRVAAFLTGMLQLVSHLLSPEGRFYAGSVLALLALVAGLTVISLALLPRLPLTIALHRRVWGPNSSVSRSGLLLGGGLFIALAALAVALNPAPPSILAAQELERHLALERREMERQATTGSEARASLERAAEAARAERLSRRAATPPDVGSGVDNQGEVAGNFRARCERLAVQRLNASIRVTDRLKVGERPSDGAVAYGFAFVTVQRGDAHTVVCWGSFDGGPERLEFQ